MGASNFPRLRHCSTRPAFACTFVVVIPTPSTFTNGRWRAGKALGPEHSDAATSVNNLIWRHFSYNQGQYAKAKPLYQRALAIWEKALDPEHPNVVTSLNNLAALSYNQGQYVKAEPLACGRWRSWKRLRWRPGKGPGPGAPKRGQQP